MLEITTGAIYVYTYREGALSRLGHDLRFTVKTFNINVEEVSAEPTLPTKPEQHSPATNDAVVGANRYSVRASFDTASLHLDGAVIAGEVVPNEIRAKDIKSIERTAHQTILAVQRHPAILFQGEARSTDPDATGNSGGAVTIDGSLEIAGRTNPLKVIVTRTNNRLQGEVSISPSRFGIAPYRALLGALRLQDNVRIRLDLPDPAIAA